MRISQLKLLSDDGRREATISRAPGEPFISVAINENGATDGRTHQVDARDDADIYSMAEILQHAMDGHRGTGSMIHDYHRELQRFAG